MTGKPSKSSVPWALKKKISVDKDIQPAVFDDGREGGKQVNASLKA